MTWKRFPFPDERFGYDGARLRKHWPRLHQGDCEPYPEPGSLAKLIARHTSLETDMAVKDAALLLQDAWRAFHRGDFAEAARLGKDLGPLGHNVENKATIIHATYLETDPERKQILLLKCAERAQGLQDRAPDIANAFYFHAQALGRYSQSISVMRALAEGLGGRIKASLERAIALEPRHADAHLALALFHAEVIGKVGALTGSLTYGASRDAALRHFDQARRLNPHSAIVHIEHANGLLALFGKAKLAEARQLYQEAVECVPADAMERLDIELARSELAA